jgi:hypothetical protein
VHLATDFKTHDEEENRHQAVVNPKVEIVLKCEAAESNSDWDVPEIRVDRSPRRIGPHERRNGDDHQDNAAGRLDGKKTLDGSENALDAFSGR